MEAKGKKIGFLAASRVIPVSSWAAGKSHPGVLTTYDPSILLNEIKAAQGQCDYLVVYVHWGIEEEYTAGGIPENAGKAVYRCRGGSGGGEPSSCTPGNRVL